MGVFFGLITTVLQLIWKLISTVFKTVYEVLMFLRLRLLALYLIVCGFVQLFWKVFSQGGNMSYFWLGFALVCAVTVVGWVLAAIRRDRKNRENKEQENKDREKEQKRRAERKRQRREKRMGKEVKSPPIASLTGGFPIYYTAEGHEDYIFAEYEDRYELYRKQDGGFVYVRTDYKDKDAQKEQS